MIVNYLFSPNDLTIFINRKKVNFILILSEKYVEKVQL